MQAPDEPPGPKMTPMTVAGQPSNYTVDGIRVDVPAPPAPHPTVAPPAAGATAFDNAASLIQGTVDAHRKFVDEVSSKATQYSPEGMAAELRRFDGAKVLDDAEAAADMRVAELKDEVDQARRALAAEPEPVQSQRIWERNLRVWDSKNDVELAATIQKAFTSATPEELGVLLNETSHYLERRGLPTGLVEPVLQQVAPDYAKAKAKVVKAEQARIIMQNNLRMARAGIAAG